jgi:hypothetical protein
VLLVGVTLAQRPAQDVLLTLPLPVEGPARVLVYVDSAAELACYATVAGLAVAIAVSEKHRRRAAALAVVAWALGSLVLAALYPSPLVRGPSLQRIYFAADLIGLFVSAVAIVRWVQRNLAARSSPDTTSFIALGLVALDATILLTPFSPWRGVVFGSDFSGIQLVITTFFGTFVVAQVLAWKRSLAG